MLKSTEWELIREKEIWINNHSIFCPSEIVFLRGFFNYFSILNSFIIKFKWNCYMASWLITYNFFESSTIKGLKYPWKPWPVPNLHNSCFVLRKKNRISNVFKLSWHTSELITTYRLRSKRLIVSHVNVLKI